MIAYAPILETEDLVTLSSVMLSPGQKDLDLPEWSRRLQSRLDREIRKVGMPSAMAMSQEAATSPQELAELLANRAEAVLNHRISLSYSRTPVEPNLLAKQVIRRESLQDFLQSLTQQESPSDLE